MAILIRGKQNNFNRENHHEQVDLYGFMGTPCSDDDEEEDENDDDDDGDDDDGDLLWLMVMNI